MCSLIEGAPRKLERKIAARRNRARTPWASATKTSAPLCLIPQADSPGGRSTPDFAQVFQPPRANLGPPAGWNPTNNHSCLDGFPLGWAIDLRLNVAGAPQNGMARAEKYEAWGGHFFGAICGSVESSKQPLMFGRVSARMGH